MIGKDIVWHCRESILDDTAVPYLWSDKELLRFGNYAEVQACRRAHLIIDRTTANDSGTAATASTMGQRPLCSFSIVADQAVYNLSSKILQVKRCMIQSQGYALDGPKTFAEMDEIMSDWYGTSGTVSTSGSGGYPYFYINEPGNTITFVRAPSKTDTALLVVSRLPLVSFTLETQPEIDERYHIGLCDWIAHLAYMKPDSDTLNIDLAKFYENKFTSTFGPLPGAAEEKWRKNISQKGRMRSRVFGS